MKRYLKRLVTVEAIQWDGTPAHARQIASMLTADGHAAAYYDNHPPKIAIRFTSDLYDRALTPGDYLVHSSGKWWVRAQADFEDSYQEME